MSNKDIILHSIAIIGVIIIIYVLCYLGFSNRNTTSPVEEYSNKVIIIVIDNKDTIKNDKVIKAKTITNDSTLSKFYDLLGY